MRMHFFVFQVDGQVFVVYNMGTMDHPIGDFYGKVSDGQYHVVRFTRSGPNSTIQVDDLNPQLKNPTGKTERTSSIYLGKPTLA